MKIRIRRGFTLVELLVVIAIIGILIALLLPAVQAAREAARRSQCSNNLKQLGLALHNYHDVNKAFPAGTGGCVSDQGGCAGGASNWAGWGGLAMLLPYVEQTALFSRLDTGTYWLSATNAPVIRTTINAFLCPSDPVVIYTTDMGPTSYNLSHGPCASWSVGAGQEVGLFSRFFWPNMANIRDGTSNTIAMAEALLGKNAGMWNAARRDPSYRVVTGSSLVQSPVTGSNRTFTNSATDLATIRAYYQNCLSMYDAGSGWSGESDEQGRYWASGRGYWAGYITTLVGPNAGPSCDVDTSPTDIDVKEPSSNHPGGVQVLKADASVTFTSQTIDQAIWIAAGTIAGGESITLP